MKVHGVYFNETNKAYDYLMEHIKNPVHNCKTCFPVTPVVVKKFRINKTKRKHLHTDIRAVVYAKSKMLCEECGAKGMAIHHIKSVSEYPELQFDLDNLIHLCLKCHADKHKNMSRRIFLENIFVTQERALCLNK